MKGNKIKYAKKRVAVSTIVHSDEYMEVIIENFEYPLTGVKRYHHSLFPLVELTACERIFLDWLTEVMGSDNSVYINEDEIRRFIATIAHTGVVYKVSTVRQAVKGLRATGMLLKIKKASGLFNVNPYFYYKGSEKDRWEAIRMIMEFDPNSDEKTNIMRLKIFKDLKKLKG